MQGAAFTKESCRRCYNDKLMIALKEIKYGSDKAPKNSTVN